MTAHIASLQMYLRPETVKAHTRYWSLIRQHLGHGDTSLSDFADIDAAWTHPDLLLSQTCGLPFRAFLKDCVTLIGTPDYGIDGCPAGFYHSVFLARSEDPRASVTDFLGAPFARNMTHSQSGWAAPEAHLAHLAPGESFRAHAIDTGGHRASAQAVAEGRADLACLDAVTWALIRRHDAFASALRVIDTTRPTPGLPYIAAPGVDAAALFAAISQAISALNSEDRDALMLKGLTRIPKARYLAEAIPPEVAH